MVIFLIAIFQLLVYASGFTKLTTIARGILPAEGVGDFYQDDDALTEMYSPTMVALEYDFGATVTGWIYTGDPKPMLITESKIVLFYYAPPWDTKILFFGGNSTHLILREDFNSALKFAECAIPYAFNSFYHFTISLRYQYIPSKFYYNWMGLRAQDGTIATCSNSITDTINIQQYAGFHWAFQVRKPQDTYAFATQPLGGITFLGDYFFNSTDTDIMRFLLNFSPNSFELFTFQFSYEQVFCNCLIDSSTNKIQGLSSLTYKQLTNYSGGGFFRFGFTYNEAISFQSGKLRFGVSTESFYRDLNITRLTDFRPTQSISVSFWMNIASTVNSFTIFTYVTNTKTFTLSVSLNSADSMYYLKINDSSTLVTLNSPIIPNVFAHYILGVSIGCVDLYTNGLFTLSKIGTFSTFFQAGITKSQMTLGGTNLPVESIVTLSQFRMFSSNSILSSLVTASSLIPNCQTLIQNQQSYTCLYCKSGYLLKSMTDCVSTCGSSNTLLTDVKMCAPSCPYSCLNCDPVNPTKCLSCSGNRVFQASTGTCYCPTGTFEDYKNKSCLTKKKFTRGFEFGQFEMVKVNTMTVQFTNEFTTPPNVAFNVLSYSQDMLQSIPLFYITASAITTTQMVVNSNANSNLYFHIQYFAYNTSNTLYYSGALMFYLNYSYPSVYLPIDKGPYASSPISVYNIQVFLGGMECTTTALVGSYDTCFYGWDYDKNNIHSYAAYYSKMVTRMYLYYILTPLDVTLIRAPLANFPYYFYDYNKSPFGLEKTSYFKPILVIPSTELQANHDETLGLDMMYTIVYNSFKMLYFSYFKLLPVVKTFYDPYNIFCNADYSMKTDLLYAIYNEAMLYYEAFSSFPNCQIVDYFTMQCTKCTNGKNPKIQCNNCATGQFFNSTAIECQCSPGYWQESEDTCIACDTSCSTCTSADACDTCKGTLVQDIALTGYCHCPDLTKWFDSTGTCYYCDDLCLTCTNGTSCTSCYSGMTQIVGGLCSCPDHQWFYAVSHSCYDCYFLCDSCTAAKSSSSQNCLTCVAGRDVVGGSCVCSGSNDLRVFMDDLRCSKGTTAVLDAVLSNDFLTLNIDFGTAIQADASISASPGAICGSLFDTSSMVKIGTDSTCAISGSSVIVSLGTLARILSGDTFIMKPNAIVFTYNSLQIIDFGRQSVSQSGTVSSSITFDYPATFNYCEKKTIKVSSIQNDGNRGIQSLTWSIVSMTPMDNITYNILQLAVQDANNSQSQFVNLEMFTAASNLVIQIKMDWVLQINQSGSKTMTVTVTRKRVFRSSYTLSQPSPYYRFKEMVVTMNFQTLTCQIDGTLVETSDLVNVQVTNSDINLNELHSNLSARTISKAFPAYSLDSNYLYTFTVFFKLSSDSSQSSSSVFSLNYELTDLYALITGGNRYINYKKDSLLESTLIDFEIDNSTNPPSGITPIWSCQDIGSGDPCLDQNGVVLTLLSNQTSTILKSTFAPFTVVRIILTGTKDHITLSGTTTRTKKSSVVAFFTEMDIPPLDVVLDDQISADFTMNLNQIIHVSLNYDASTNPDNLFFAGAILYNSTVVATMSFEYSFIRFKVWNYYSAFNPSDTAFQIRFSAYNPAYILPSITTISFNLNFPPSSCTFTATPTSTPVYALETVFDILMDNCVDLNTPITYQFFYYDSQAALDFETQNPLKVQRKQLNDRGASNTISSVLPAGNIVLIAQAIDNREAIANITITKNLNTQVLAAADYLTFVDNFITAAQVLIPEQQIINLNLLTGDLLNRGVALLVASDLQAKKMQIISLLEAAALAILSSSYLNQLASQAISQILATPVTLSQTEQISKLTSVQTSLSTIQSNCASSQVSQEKYQKCVENMYLTFNQVDGISQNSVSGVSTIDSSFISLTENIGDILTEYALPNEDSVEYSGSLMNIKSQKITDKLMINYLGMSQTRLRLLTASSSSSSAIYDASFKTYTNNLYSNDASFKDYAASVANYTNNTQMTTVFPVINPSVKTTSNGSAYNIPSEAAHFFKNTEPKRNLTCFSKSKSTSKWTTTGCSTYLSSKTNEIQCFCQELSPTTVVEDISSLFTNNKNLATAFSSAGLANISNFTNFYLYVVFWVLLIQTVGLIALIIKGRALDAVNINLLQSEQSQLTLNRILSAKIMPINSPAETLKNITYNKMKSIEPDQPPMSSPSIKILPEIRSINKMVPMNSDQASADRHIEIFDPKKDNLFLKIENISKQNSKSKSSFASVIPEEKMENEDLDQEHNDCESPDDKHHQTLQDDSEKNLKSNEQRIELSKIKDEDNPDQSLTKTKRASKVQYVKGEQGDKQQDNQQQQTGIKKNFTYRQVSKAKEIEQHDKKKLESINKYLFFLYFHDFFSIFLVFLQDLSRSVRFVLFYLRYTHTLVFSILFSGITKSIVQTIFISLFSSIVIAVLSKLVSTLLGKTGVIKKIGALFTFSVITFYLYLILSIQSGSPYYESNSFVWSYVTFLIMDVVVVQTVTAIVFSFVAQKVIRQDSNHGGFFFKVFDFLKLNIILTSLLNFSK